MSATTETIIADVRQFNRFYTRTIGVLGEGLLGGECSLSEARVLYEIAHNDRLLATDLVKILGVDFGYLSRILAVFEKRGWIKRERSASDARKSHVLLTAKGRKTFAMLNQQARDEVAKLLEPLPLPQQQQLQAHLRQVQSLLSFSLACAQPRAMEPNWSQSRHRDVPAAAAGGERPGKSHAFSHGRHSASGRMPESLFVNSADPVPTVTLRTHRAGDMGWIIQRHGVLYEKEYGFNSEFEALVAEICAKFLREFDPAAERCWIAELGGVPVGTIMLVRGSEDVAKLRLLLVEDSARGLGVGRMLVEECVNFARQAGYRSMTLWTQSNLIAARKLYQSAGFACVGSEAHTSFGQALIGETWTLRFAPEDNQPASTT